MKIGKKAKALAIGLAFTAAAGMATVRKAAADLIRFDYKPAAPFSYISEPSLGSGITAASVTVDIPENFSSGYFYLPFNDWMISTKDGSVGYTLKMGDPETWPSYSVLYIEKVGNGFNLQNWLLAALSNLVVIATKNINNSEQEIARVPGTYTYNLNCGPTGSWSAVPVVPPSVPIPGSALLFGTGLAGLAARALKRRRGNLPRKTLG